MPAAAKTTATFAPKRSSVLAKVKQDVAREKREARLETFQRFFPQIIAVAILVLGYATMWLSLAAIMVVAG